MSKTTAKDKARRLSALRVELSELEAKASFVFSRSKRMNANHKAEAVRAEIAKVEAEEVQP